MMLFYNNTWKMLPLLYFLFAAHLRVGATNYTLTANDFASNQWSDPTVWAPNGVPGAGDDVTINGTGNTALITNGNMTAGGLLHVVVPPGSSLNGSIKVIQTTGTFTGTYSWHLSTCIIR